LLAAVRFIGPAGVIRTLRYTWAKARLERRWRAPNADGALAPGVLQEVVHLPGGGRCRFQHMTLEAQFLAPDLLRMTWLPGTLPVPYAVLRTEWSPPPVRVRQGGTGCQLHSDLLRAEIDMDGSVRVRDAGGRLLRE
jgi:alpha-glucosidase